MDTKRVLVLSDQGVALLGDDRLDDHLAGVHQELSFAVWASPSSAAAETIIEAAPTTSATPASSAESTDTSSMFRKDRAHASSSLLSSTRTGRCASQPSSAS